MKLIRLRMIAVGCCIVGLILVLVGGTSALFAAPYSIRGVPDSLGTVKGDTVTSLRVGVFNARLRPVRVLHAGALCAGVESGESLGPMQTAWFDLPFDVRHLSSGPQRHKVGIVLERDGEQTLVTKEVTFHVVR